MKISLQWLSDFVTVDEFFKKPEALADLLTKAGLEVEEIHQKAKDFQFVVTGLILEKGKHPNADKLSLCKVMTGDGVVHQIVCGAQNHQQNDKVVVALPGAVLPGNFVIKQAQVRGVDSAGMLCSLKELGLPETVPASSGIVILPENAPVGKSFAEYMGFDDVTFELKVTPNRADCLSHYGLAREVSCLLGRSLKAMPANLALAEGSTKKEISLSVKSELCPRYAGRFIRGVKVGPSPDWLQKRLESVGMNSINNVVDVTNYVMLELGQPLHAFDAAQIHGKQIIVDLSSAGETFQTLDGTELKLTGEELMIKDADRCVAMAGVVGGKNSGVSETTTDLFLEAAYFLPRAVRKASRQFGVSTDSAYRFSRGVDPEGTQRAMDRATELLLKVAGGEALGDAHDHYPAPVSKQKITVSVKTISQRLGYAAEATQLQDYLLRLGCQVEVLSEGVFSVLPPAFRFDLEMEMDFVEEYARLNGYDLIPETLPKASQLMPTPHDVVYTQVYKVSECLRAFGFSQALNLVFQGDAKQRQFLGDLAALKLAGLSLSEAPVAVVNPLGADQNVLRQSLVQGLFQNVIHNFHQGEAQGRLFETGKIFSNTADAGKYHEQQQLGMVAWGQPAGLWDKGPVAPLIFEVKAALEKLFQELHIGSVQWESAGQSNEVPDFIHLGQFAKIKVEGSVIGFIGSAHPVLLEDEKIRVPVVFVEINLDQLLRGQPRSFKVESFARFPKMERDLALLMPKTLKAVDVTREIKKAAGALLTSVSVFDLYEGDNLPAGKKSVAFRMSFQDKAATLQEALVNDSMSKILEALKQKLGVEVR